MKKIPLSKGYFAVVDDEDYETLKQYKWWANESRKGETYAMGRINGRNVYMHRFLMDAKTGQVVDHKNRDRLDNRRENLRFATRSQSQANRTVQPGKGSRYRGVIRTPSHTFRSSIRVDRNSKTLGTFACEIEAAKAYDAAARKYYGEFAVVNFFPGNQS